MNSNIDAYKAKVIANNAKALTDGRISLAESLPCLVARELEPLNNQFVDSSDPFMMSYRALRRIQRVARPIIPRKIAFDSAVYLKEGIVDCIFPNSPVTLILIGDGNSDKRFSFNCYRLFCTFDKSFRTYSFVCNGELIGVPFGSDGPVTPGWTGPKADHHLYYHATEWSELDHFRKLVADELRMGQQVLVLVDLDGTYLCPRPHYHGSVRSARRDAMAALSAEIFDAPTFAPDALENLTRLNAAYDEASKTRFAQNYDDEDLTMLVALGLFAEIIGPDDVLLNPVNGVGFTEPIEWLQYASFLIVNNRLWENSLRRLRALYTRCADAIQDGSPTAFSDFRRREEEFLIARAANQEVTLNRRVTQFIADTTLLGAVPIGFSDRPNASLGLDTMLTTTYTTIARPRALINEWLELVG